MLNHIWLGIMVLTIPFCGIDDGSEFQLLHDLLMPSSCEITPCFLGVPLEEISNDSIGEVLETSPVLQDATIVYDGESRITWRWGESVASELTYSPYYLEDNHVSFFDDGSIREFQFSFAIQLEDLIDWLGEPDFVYPYTFFRSNILYHIVYEEIGGSFGVWLECENPSLQSDSVISHFNVRIINHQTPPIIEWDGYPDELPNCSVFQP